MVKKLNNKGLTLVELVIAIAISTIVIGAAAMFLYNAERTYRVAEHAINLQMETQVLMEQLGNWVLDSNQVFFVNDTASGSEFPSDVLVLYYIPRDNGKDLASVFPSLFTDYQESDNLATRRIIFCNDGKLYMKEEQNIANASEQYELLVKANASAGLFTIGDEEDDTRDNKPENCIGEFVAQFNVTKTDFSVDMSLVDSITISVLAKQGTQRYLSNDAFTLRNGLHYVPTPSAAPEVTDEGGDGDEG